MKKANTVLWLAVLCTACATSEPPPPHLSPFDTSESSATIELQNPLARRELVELLTFGECQTRFNGARTPDIFSTRVFGGATKDQRQVKVRTDTPVTIRYTFGISDKTCTVAGTTFLLPGRSYVVRSSPTFSRGLLPVSTGCEIQVLDKEAQTVVPLVSAAMLSIKTCRPGG
jgi:hypothetical protein